MALKPARRIIHDNNSFFMNEVAERGGVVCVSTAGSGIAQDQSNAVVTYDATPSGATPIGLLLEDVVNKDLTDTAQNYHRTEVQLGGKVTLVIKGEVTTDMLEAGTISAGNYAYLSNSGLLQPTQVGGTTVSPLVGKFLSTKDENGFAKVLVDL